MFIPNNESQPSGNQSTGGETGTCKTGVCDILMIIFGCIGALLLIAFIVVVVRYNMQTKDESGPIAASLVG